MLLKLKKLLATDLVKVTSLNGMATLVRMMTGLVIGESCSYSVRNRRNGLVGTAHQL